jgi:histidinol-phosphate aminotransferase
MVRTRFGSSAEYVAGKQSLEGIEDARAVRLASNEYPLPPLPSVQAAMAASLADANRYPEPLADSLREVIAQYHGVTPDMVTVGSGAGPIAERAVMATCGPEQELIYGLPSFIGYSSYAASAGTQVVAVPLDANQANDLDAMAQAATDRTGAILVCNPNNPTGAGIKSGSLRRFMDHIPSDLLVIVDEAYIDFAGPDCDRAIPLIPDYENLMVLRTFSKAHGLAGMRIGYAIAQVPTIAVVNRSRSPFQISNVAMAAAMASLQAADELAERAAFIVAEREWVSAQLDAMSVSYTRSDGNFIWIGMAPQRAAEVTERIESAGVLVRGLPRGVRVTIGTRAQNEAFLAALSNALN